MTLEAKEWFNLVDKTKWPQGEWNNEPDKAQWVTESGLHGLIVRNYGGALCGYAGLPEGHPLFGKEYDRAYDYVNIDVHGGLTFSDRCSGDPDGHSICHKADDEVWWLGFDTAHSGDMSPAYVGRLDSQYCQYRNLAYVKREVESLARQLAEIKQ